MAGSRIVRVGGQADDQRTLESALKDAGMNDVRFVASGEALEAVKSGDLDLLLLDVMQPTADVLQLLGAAAGGEDASNRIPVIVTGPLAAADRMQACLQRGAEDFLTTPFPPKNPLMVTRRISLALHRRRLREAKFRLASSTTDPNETAVIQIESDPSGRFVPREFLEHLERKSFADIRLGDHVQRAMTVFFSDIRDFTSLSEQMTPQENFKFLNSYLGRVTPIIRGHKGFIDKYIGDAVMALFPGAPADAMEAALEIQQQVAAFNHNRRESGAPDIRIGIGMHRGELILGTIGDGERMQTTVIADAVGVAERIEGLTKTFGVVLLVSNSVVEGLPRGHHFRLRHLGAIEAKGKKQDVEVYECYNGDPDDLREHKDKFADTFANAMSEFRRSNYLAAGRLFSKVAEQHPRDRAAAYFRDRCTMTVLQAQSPGALAHSG